MTDTPELDTALEGIARSLDGSGNGQNGQICDRVFQQPDPDV